MQKVIIYTSAICPYCIRAKQLLQKKGAAYEEIRIDLDANRMEEMMRLSQRRTVPQIWIGDHHVGGCDELYALEAQHKLDGLLAGQN